MSIYTRVSDSCSMKKLASTAPPQIQYVRFIYRMGAVLYYVVVPVLVKFGFEAIYSWCRYYYIIPTPTVCYSVPSIVEVSGGCQSVIIICLRQRGITIVKLFASYA